MREYNLLTQKLLSEGYTAENYPDYVRLPKGWDKKDPLHNLQDGFEYTPQYRNKMVFRTGCGLLVKGSHFSCGGMGYMGINWIPENDNPVLPCPYRKDLCSLRNPLLGGTTGGGLSKIFQCDCHQTDEPYVYEKSVDKVKDDYERMKRQKYEAFFDKTKGHMCHWHMHWSDRKQEWSQHYDPMVCARNCLNGGKECDLRHKPVSKKRGNVFYDVKVSHIRHDGTLFDGQEIAKIYKGVRLFETGKSMTICEEVAKRCTEDIQKKECDKRGTEILLRGWKVEVSNVHAEQRESRDLMQDLQDIQDGIEVIHASDLEKSDKADKKERRKQAQEKRIRKLEKKLLEVGYYNLEEHSLDRRHADKWLGEERVAELEQERKQKMKEKENRPVQMSLLDFPEFAEEML